MTRMWLVDPQLMCDRHLQGEYNEIHKLLGGVVNHRHGLAILRGQQDKGNIDLSRLFERYEELQVEMCGRGFKHDAVLVHRPVVVNGVETEISSKRNLEELYRRCEGCRGRIERHEQTEEVSDLE